MKSSDKELLILKGTIGLAIFGIILFMVAVSTNHWVDLNLPHGEYNEETEMYVMKYHLGIFRICRTELFNKTKSRIYVDDCDTPEMWPTQKEIAKNPEIDKTILHYTRAEIGFSVISLLLMVIDIAFSIYALNHVRYMYRRVAGILFCITASTIFVVNQVFDHSIDYEQHFLQERHPKGAKYTFGFSIYLSYSAFAIFIVAGIVFIYASKKRKGKQAYSVREAAENEPVNIGRY